MIFFKSTKIYFYFIICTCNFDFVLQVNGKYIAVELTHFHSDRTTPLGHPHRGVEEQWWQHLLPPIEQQRIGDTTLRRVKALLCFKELLLPPRRKYGQFVGQLMEFIRKEFNTAELEATFRDFGPGYPLLGEYLREICVERAGEDIPPELLQWQWNHDVAWAGLGESELLAAILPKLDSSRPTGISDNWLLVVSGHRLSQCMGLPEVSQFKRYRQVNQALIKGPYDKVYIFQYMFGRVILWQPGTGWTVVRKARFANGHEVR